MRYSLVRVISVLIGVFLTRENLVFFGKKLVEGQAAAATAGTIYYEVEVSIANAASAFNEYWSAGQPWVGMVTWSGDRVTARRYLRIELARLPPRRCRRWEGAGRNVIKLV